MKYNFITCLDKYNFHIIICVVMLFSCNAFKISNYKSKSSNDKTIRSYYENGNIEYQAKYLNGKLDGLSTTWHLNGKISSESYYNNGLPHGAWKKYHENGKILYYVEYEFGKKNGKEQWYYNNGMIQSEQNFIYGEKDGNLIRWRSDGTLLY